MQTKRTTTLLVLSILTVLLSVGVFVFFLKIIKNKNEHTGAVLTTLENKMLDKKNANELTRQVAQVETINTTLNTYFVDPGQIDSFVNYLESLGTSSSTIVSVKSVEVSKTEGATLLVQLSAEGDFSNVIHTIKLIENMPYKVSLQQIFITKSAKSVVDATSPTQKPKEISSWKAVVSFGVLLLP